ncbi:hypothetical protein PIB30_087002, partial [Stylosanthes scabra]|nr:hypothetical protein [Stylosanthes scabra]
HELMRRLASRTRRLLEINPSMVSQLSTIMVSTKVARTALVSTLRTPGTLSCKAQPYSLTMEQ